MYLNVLSPNPPPPHFSFNQPCFCCIIRNFSASASTSLSAVISQQNRCTSRRRLVKPIRLYSSIFSADIPILAALSHLSKTRQCVLIVKRSRRPSFIRHTAPKSPSFMQSGVYSEPQEASYHLNFMAKLTFFIVCVCVSAFVPKKCRHLGRRQQTLFFFFF